MLKAMIDYANMSEEEIQAQTDRIMNDELRKQNLKEKCVVQVKQHINYILNCRNENYICKLKTIIESNEYLYAKGMDEELKIFDLFVNSVVYDEELGKMEHSIEKMNQNYTKIKFLLFRIQAGCSEEEIQEAYLGINWDIMNADFAWSVLRESLVADKYLVAGVLKRILEQDNRSEFAKKLIEKVEKI